MRVLVLFAHPAQRKSSINLAMADVARRVDGVTFVDLYEEYPRFQINIDREQKRLLDHDVIVFQFPIYWYSTPSLLKEWQDLVLEYGFAYGPQGKLLADKFALISVTTGGRVTDYSVTGGNNYPLRQFLLPLQQTATLCGMKFLPPFVLHAANHISTLEAQRHVASYGALLGLITTNQLDLDEAIARDTIFPVDLPIMAEN
ncbi:potassium transporter KefG [Rhizobium leguminosarum]|uniref:NAD(P)H-dependent oxidoreductase n=1 Tax=Rhizobium leguminosarum TaxID=384 RepID=UPI001C98A9FB|nr:NAD(P)H-dependent oxidoreductase [Rhizobium leguminosarum]MBY5445760.1 potassium transporter KefG [Rhizobium leguminosarum]